MSVILSSNGLSRVAVRLHAAGVGGLSLLIILVDVVQTIQRPTHGPDEAPDRGASPGALAASRYSASCRPDGCTPPRLRWRRPSPPRWSCPADSAAWLRICYTRRLRFGSGPSMQD